MALKNLDFDPQRLTHEVCELGEDWADKDAAASTYEESKKTVLSQYVMEIVRESSELVASGQKARVKSVAMAELEAQADPRYEMHIQLMVEARKEANKARVRYDMGKMKLELLRSLQANLRNELRHLGST